MPPKAATRRPLSAATGPPVSSSQRDSFSIASFFDAANGRRTGGGGGSGAGGGYRVGGYDGIVSGASNSFHGQQRDHWSSSSSVPSSPAIGVRERDSLPGDVSSTLQAVWRRIMAELQGAQSGQNDARRGAGLSGCGGSLHEHRQRALSIAFGENSGPSSRLSTGASVASTAASPTRPRARDVVGNQEGEDAEDDLVVSSVEFSLLCPYARVPIRHPVRSRECDHVQCCDLNSWMVMLDKCRSLRDPVGPCPVCERRVVASSLEVDLWMLHVIEQMPAGTHMVMLELDGSFRSGDSSREKKKAQLMTEVVDATQGDYHNYLGEVVDDDEAVSEIPLVHVENYSVGSRRPRSQSPNSAEGRTGRPLQTVASSPFHVHVKKERESFSAEPAEIASTTTTAAEATSQSDGCVVVVHFLESAMRDRRVLPSQVRLWTPHCMNCGAARVKTEEGVVEGCQSCGRDAKDDWSLLRRFDESPAVTLELLPDGTLLLRGVDIAAPFFFRAGFWRSLFEVEEYAPLESRGRKPSVGVWVTTFPLNRFELDFVEACCHGVAQGKAMEQLEEMVMPSLFRIPRRRRPAGGLGVTQTNYLNRAAGAWGSPSNPGSSEPTQESFRFSS